MRLIYILIFVVIWINSFGQNNRNEIPDCEVLTLNVVNQLSEKLEKNQLDSFDIIINNWIKACSTSECTQRLIILKNIMDNEKSINSIRTYFEHDFHYLFKNRIKDSKRIDYGYIYYANKAYYGYVPLRHSIDSIVQKISLDLLKKERLTSDERLICIMFSGDTERFEKEIKSHKYKESFIKQYLFDNHRDNLNRWLSYTIYSGVFRPISTNDVFTYSPMIGLTFSSPISNKLIVELGMKVRININDDSFNYYALGDTNYVNSDYSIFFGGLVSYKMYESEKLILLPKFGIGLESVDTGISEKKDYSNDKVYYNVNTVHLSLGLSAMTPIFQKSYLGFGINYHYCPYQLDDNLYTDFDSNLISAEVFWRF